MTKRIVMVLAAVAVGGVAAFAVSRIDVEQAILEVTLPLRHDDIIRQQAAEEDLDPALVAAVIYAESRFEPRESPAGALGLMQITPQTAEHIARLSGGTDFVLSDLDDPDINISYGTYYLRYLLDRYEGNEVAALAAYNAGTSNADDWGGAELTQGSLEEVGFAETHEYVDEVLDKREEYREKHGDALGL